MTIEELKLNILKKFSILTNVNKILLFGSRARRDNKYNSDYDIAIFGQCTLSEKSNIRYFFNEEIDSLCKFDVVFINQVENKKLLENINNEGVVLYERL